MTSLAGSRSMRSMVTVLVTGFGPFGDVRHNPSQALLQALPNHLGDVRVVTAVLPVDAQIVGNVLAGLALLDPKVVIHTGVATDRSVISFETGADNRMDFTIPDNAGRIFKSQQVIEGGPPRLESRLPSRRVLEAWRKADLPCELSPSAGAFLCNQTFYLSLYTLPRELPVGFVHLPPDETLGPQLGLPHVPLAQMKKAIVLALESCIVRKEKRV